jgi:hypothetical protein
MRTNDARATGVARSRERVDGRVWTGAAGEQLGRPGARLLSRRRGLVLRERLRGNNGLAAIDRCAGGCCCAASRLAAAPVSM